MKAFSFSALCILLSCLTPLQAQELSDSTSSNVTITAGSLEPFGSSGVGRILYSSTMFDGAETVPFCNHYRCGNGYTQYKVVGNKIFRKDRYTSYQYVEVPRCTAPNKCQNYRGTISEFSLDGVVLLGSTNANTISYYATSAYPGSVTPRIFSAGITGAVISGYKVRWLR